MTCGTKGSLLWISLSPLMQILTSEAWWVQMSLCRSGGDWYLVMLVKFILSFNLLEQSEKDFDLDVRTRRWTWIRTTQNCSSKRSQSHTPPPPPPLSWLRRWWEAILCQEVSKFYNKKHFDFYNKNMQFYMNYSFMTKRLIKKLWFCSISDVYDRKSCF